MWEQTLGTTRRITEGEGPVIMNTQHRKGGRLVLLAVAIIVVGMILAVPATAYGAKSATKIVAVKTMTVDHSNPAVNPWPKSLTAKLYKKISGKGFRALSGTMKLYRWDPQAKSGDGAYALVASKKGSSVSFSIPGRGKYKISYAGSSKTRPATAYSGVYESFGLTVSTPVISIEPIAATTKSWVNVKYDVDWNSEALDAPLILSYEGWFEDNADEKYSSWVYYEREVWAPQAVEFNYKVENLDVLDLLKTVGFAYGEEWFRGDYITSSARRTYLYAIP
jgi:hypothetical protein